MEGISCIVPISDSEEGFTEFLSRFVAVQFDFIELIFSLVDSAPGQLQNLNEAIHHAKVNIPIVIVTGSKGRAGQQNRGALRASGDYLFFLHFDCQFDPLFSSRFRQILRERDDGKTLWYHDFAFVDDFGSPLLKLTQVMANLRCKLLRLPFGDQGFCMHRQMFFTLGGFPENCLVGEDHRFVWLARREKFAIEPLGLPLGTSARKYQQYGWLRVTSLHLRLTLSQIWSGLNAVREQP